jgi:hypothetical protein
MRVARAAFMICVICLASGVALAKSKPKPKPKPFTNATIRISGTAFTLGAFCTGYAANCPGGGCTCYQDQTAKAKGPLLPKKASADLTLNVDEAATQCHHQTMARKHMACSRAPRWILGPARSD